MNQDEISVRRMVAEAAARAAGGVHIQRRGEKVQRDIKTDRTDYATRVDYESNDAARDVILRAFPGETVIGEEDAPESLEELAAALEKGTWLIDPLDGTMEYVHGAPYFSAIVSYVVGNQTQACAINFAAFGLAFSAGAGEGATLNGEAIHTSGQTELSAAILGTTYRSASPQRAEAFTRVLNRLLPQVEAFRVPGAPGLDACAVAAGWYDMFAVSIGQTFAGESKGQPWETAAFDLLVREAGGATGALNGGPVDMLRLNAYAATEPLLRSLLAAIDTASA